MNQSHATGLNPYPDGAGTTRWLKLKQGCIHVPAQKTTPLEETSSLKKSLPLKRLSLQPVSAGNAARG